MARPEKAPHTSQLIGYTIHTLILMARPEEEVDIQTDILTHILTHSHTLHYKTEKS